MTDETPNKLAPIDENRLASRLGESADQLVQFQALVEAWLVDKADTTRESYRKNLEAFARWGGYQSTLAAIVDLFSLPAPGPYQIVDKFRGDMIEQQLGPSTINSRLSTLRSLSRKATAAGLLTTPLLNDGVHETEPETRAVSAEEWATLIDYLRDQCDPAGTRDEYYARRDLAALRLMRDVGFRRKEVVALREIDFARKTVTTSPKGPRGSTLVHPVDGEAWECLMDWLEIRDVGWDGQKVDPTVGRPPLLWRSVGTLNTMLRRVSQRAGLPHLTPHMFRRAGVTAVVTHHGGNQRKTMGFSRHKSAKMVDRYDKANREELIREAQRELGEDFDK